MKGILSNIKDFYCYYHTFSKIESTNPYQVVIKTSLCTRKDFIEAAFDGSAFLIYHVALTALSALIVVATVGLVCSFKASFSKNAYEGIVYAGSIPVSIGGIISPQMVNQNFLKLNANEYKQTIAPGALTAIAIFGSVVMRQRLPIK